MSQDPKRVEVVPGITVKRASGDCAPAREIAQKYLAAGRRVSIRLWQSEPGDATKPPSRRDYETVNHVIGGRAELHFGGRTQLLQRGDSWLVPPDAEHSYAILEPFTAIEAAAPPARVHGRDSPA